MSLPGQFILSRNNTGCPFPRRRLGRKENLWEGFFPEVFTHGGGRGMVE